MDDCIHFFDFGNIAYTAYYANGFAQNQRKFGYKFHVAHTPPPILQDLWPPAEEEQTALSATAVFRADIDGQAIDFCIDGRDSAHPDRAWGYHLGLLERVHHYFKVNYNSQAIDESPELAPFRAKIHPVLPAFSVKPEEWHAVGRPSSLSHIGHQVADVRQRIRQLRHTIPLSKFHKLRSHPREIDVFFVMRYYRPGKHTGVSETRHEIVRKLADHPEINAVVGLVSNHDLPARYQDLHVAQFGFEEYLTNLARARIALYVRGPHECISFKFGELMALGKPIVGQQLLNNRSMLYDLPYFDEQFNYESADDVVDRVAHLVSCPEHLDRLAAANARTYDTHLAPQASVARLLDTYFYPS